MNTARIKIEWPRKARGLKALAAVFGDGLSVNRADAARIVRALGFSALTGGHHVAVHRSLPNGEAHSLRLAIITGTGPDWD